MKIEIEQDKFWNDERLNSYLKVRTNDENAQPLSEYAEAIERSLKRSIFALADLQQELICREGMNGAMQHCQLGNSGASNADFEWIEYDYSEYTVEELKKLQESWSVELFPGEEISIAESDRINAELQYAGSELHLISGMFSGYRKVLLGRCRKVNGKGNTFYLEVLEEHAKTPGVADNIASLSQPGLYAILIEGCARIAAIKYKPFLRMALSEVNDQGNPKTLSTLQKRLCLALIRSYITRLGKDDTRLMKELTRDVELQSRLYCQGQLNQHLVFGLDNIALINALGSNLKSLECSTHHPKLGDFKGMVVFTECGAETGGTLFEINRIARIDPIRAREMLLMFLSDYIYMDIRGQFEEKSLMVLAAFLPCICGGVLSLEALERAIKWWNDYINGPFIHFLSEIQALVLAARHYNPPDSDHIISRDLVEAQLIKFLSDNASNPLTLKEKKKREKSFAWVNAMWSNRLLLMSRLGLEDYTELAGRVFEFVPKTNASMVSAIHPGWTGRKSDLKGIVEILCQETI
ncbi:hypothetical protein [Desulfobacula toluolica]|uniref:Uncharacterized protein n=1 Tax=Desulfobacula toluolica (strain DSM 7467 / Tol2) TaxID=651182 RepID=K0NT13_DESTT|nr:hypothetical protein [Desulfobacula toluolica]CCK82167.1 uncharacterized protein TOL2_C40120 [Desulfobacula toluolica Tol2]